MHEIATQMSMGITLDWVVSVSIVVGAMGYLFFYIAKPNKRPVSSCCPPSSAQINAQKNPAASAPVVLGAGLQRALQKAQQKQKNQNQ